MCVCVGGGGGEGGEEEGKGEKECVEGSAECQLPDGADRDPDDHAHC